MRATVRNMKLATLFITTVLTLTGESMASNLERTRQFFDRLDKHHLELVDRFYDPDATFQDPIHRLRGSTAVKSYYERLYKEVDSIRFEYFKALESENLVSLEWRMHLTTPALNGGRELTVDGASLIEFGGREGKAVSHRDYFDMGEFVYERVPILGWLIREIKERF
jgi:hypothetical protein